MCQRSALLLVFSALFLCASIASADIYDVTVNTTTFDGTTGSLDFNFNPGPLVTEPAMLTISSFATNGTLVPGACNPTPPPASGPCLTGDVSGTLPGTLSFDNLTAFNDYFQDFTFGTTLSFDVSLSGMPGGTSGSTFAFSMFSDEAGTMPILTTDPADGWAVTIDVNLDGSTTANDLIDPVAAPGSTVTPAGAAAAVPEPGSLLLLATILVSMAGVRLWVQKAKKSPGKDNPCLPSA